MRRLLLVLLAVLAAPFALAKAGPWIAAVVISPQPVVLHHPDGSTQVQIIGPQAPWPEWVPVPAGAAFAVRAWLGPSPGRTSSGYGELTFKGEARAIAAAYARRLEADGWTLEVFRHTERYTRPRRALRHRLHGAGDAHGRRPDDRGDLRDGAEGGRGQAALVRAPSARPGRCPHRSALLRAWRSGAQAPSGLARVDRRLPHPGGAAADARIEALHPVGDGGVQHRVPHAAGEAAVVAELLRSRPSMARSTTFCSRRRWSMSSLARFR